MFKKVSLSTRDLAYLRQQYVIETYCNHCAQLALPANISQTTSVLLHSSIVSYLCRGQHVLFIHLFPPQSASGGSLRHIHQIRYLLLKSRLVLQRRGTRPPAPGQSFSLLLSHQAPQPRVVLYTCSSAQKALPPQHVGLPRPSLTTLLSLNQPPITFLSPASAFHS